MGTEGLPPWLSGKESTCQCRRCGFNSWVGKIPWRRKWHPLKYSCLGNPMDRGAWQATDHKVTKSRTWLSDWAGRQGMRTDILLLRIMVGTNEPLWSGFTRIPPGRWAWVPGSKAGWPWCPVDTLQQPSPSKNTSVFWHRGTTWSENETLSSESDLNFETH